MSRHDLVHYKNLPSDSICNPPTVPNRRPSTPSIGQYLPIRSNMKNLIRTLKTRLLTKPNIPLYEAQKTWENLRKEHGLKGHPPLLTPPTANRKLNKTGTFGLSLTPNTKSGQNVCCYATPSCVAGCIDYTGGGMYPSTQTARLCRTRLLTEYPEVFGTLLAQEISGIHPNIRIRLNVFSDITWETVAPWLFEGEHFFYDYTKWPKRTPPENYHLTFSASEKTTNQTILKYINNGTNVAVVFRTLPTFYLGIPVVDGDASDARYEDPTGVIVGLRAKGLMRTNPTAMLMIKGEHHEKI